MKYGLLVKDGSRKIRGNVCKTYFYYFSVTLFVSIVCLPLPFMSNVFFSCFPFVPFFVLFSLKFCLFLFHHGPFFLPHFLYCSVCSPFDFTDFVLGVIFWFICLSFLVPPFFSCSILFPLFSVPPLLFHPSCFYCYSMFLYHPLSFIFHLKWMEVLMMGIPYKWRF